MGQISVICGSMFCGKTEDLIRRIKRLVIANMAHQVFKHSNDDRYNGIQVLSSHNGSTYPCEPVGSSIELFYAVLPDIFNVFVDEAQFFDKDLPDVVTALSSLGKKVVLAGLDTDFRGVGFGPMPELLSRADPVIKLYAVCTVCGEEAVRTQRFVGNKPAHYNSAIIQVGADEAYEARCLRHHEVPGKPEFKLPSAVQMQFSGI